ncbi:MAG: hypothetical protein JW751_20245 [Polyangiaceae bacterium]|nr:hypothetical protein [Polyangiaceae bacterium]
MTQGVWRWLRLGIVSLHVLTACNGEDGSDGPAGSGGEAASLGGNAGLGASQTAEGGSATGGLSVTTGGAPLPSGGATTGSAAGTGAMPAAGGAPATGGTQPAAGGTLPTTGGTQPAAGGTLPTTGGAATGGDLTNTGGLANTGGLTTGGTATGGYAPTGGTGGTVAGDTICGTAAEGEGVTLTCPDGQIVDSVVFASYGTPSGSCGALAIGDCHSESSASRVNSLCAGRGGCTVYASNSTFGDPCNSVVKSLAVELACVVGDPIVDEGIPFKGVANCAASELAALGATWCHNWGTRPEPGYCDDPLFVPMVRAKGTENVGDAFSRLEAEIQQIGNAGYDTVLGFNEPNKTDQDNLLVARAIELWPAVTSDPDIRVGSPAVSDDGRAWLEEFMAEVQANGLRVDFVAMHWYGWNEGSCIPSALEGAINWAEQWGLPVWITEFGCMGSSHPDEQTLLDFFPPAAAMIESHQLVERYAWYPWNPFNHLYLDDEGGGRSITALGEAFAAATQYR